jgi:hypothetical protein
LTGSVDPDGIQLGDCHFDYVAEAEYEASALNPYGAGQVVPCVPAAGSIPGDSSVHAVSAELTGLVPGVTYHFRLQASTDGAGFGEDATFSTPPPPAITGVSTGNLTAGSVDLDAQVNPEGAASTYRFEWGTSTGYGSSVPVPDGDLGSGGSPVPVAARLSGLSAGTTYHWRVVASNASGVSVTGDQTFVYDTSGGGLPDGREYEMVTPVRKNGALPGNIVFGVPPAVADDGSRLIVGSIQCFAGSGSCTAERGVYEGEPFEFTRTPGGWVTTAMAPPASRFGSLDNSEVAVNADTGSALFSIATPPFGENDYWVRRPDGSFADIGQERLPSEGPRIPAGGRFVGTADFSHLLAGVGEFVGVGNTQPTPVGVSGGAGSTDLISACGTEPGGEHAGAAGGTLGGISADGSVVFFTAVKCASGTGVNAHTPVPVNTLYARIDLSRTVQISAGAEAAGFQGAAADGSRVFFTEGGNLYQYDFDSSAGHNVVDASAGDTSGGGPRLQGVLASSEDGSHIYFVAGGVLTTVANDEGQVAREGANNLYVFERDSNFPGGRVAFVASLPGVDAEQWRVTLWADASANVTPDGRFLVFTSHARLTADDTSVTGAAQVFRYDALTGEMVRVSTGERGFNDNGNAGLADAEIVRAVYGLENHNPARTDPTMSDDGSFVFFESPVGLTPGALNDVQIGVNVKGNESPVYANNVYEWHEGRVYLISDGRDTSQFFSQLEEVEGYSAVQLVGSDVSGSNVFFTSADHLVPQDTDTGVNYWDARICTAGEPCPAPAVSVPPCAGEACHGTPPGAPVFGAPSSAVFSGTGNVAAQTRPVVKAKKKAAKRARPKRKARGRKRMRQHGKRGGKK